jgi:hypothetical protein
MSMALSCQITKLHSASPQFLLDALQAGGNVNFVILAFLDGDVGRLVGSGYKAKEFHQHLGFEIDSTAGR